MKPLLIAAFAVASAACLACGNSDKADGSGGAACANDTTAETYVAGLSKTTAGGLKIAIESATPAPPRMGRNQWTLRITDANGDPVTGATVKISCRMIGHTHGCAVDPDVLEMGNGEYQAGDVDPDAGIAAIVMAMSGHWDITIAVDRQSLPEETAMFSFCL